MTFRWPSRLQIVYPLSVDSQFSSSDETEQLLRYVDLANLGNLLDRVGGLDRRAEWNWDDVLSPGETQRLAFIRLLYHRPLMAFLDEATSAVDMHMETLLYASAVDLGITLISVGHRHSLRAFHQWTLNLSGDGAWALQPMSSSSGQ